MYNLTDSQKDLLRWIVKQVRDGNLSEEFMVVWHMGGSSIVGFSGKEEDVPKISKGALDAFTQNELMLCDPRYATSAQLVYSGTRSTQYEESRHCTLTGKAYEAVDDYATFFL